jgi:hypothetical protein
VSRHYSPPRQLWGGPKDGLPVPTLADIPPDGYGKPEHLGAQRWVWRWTYPRPHLPIYSPCDCRNPGCPAQLHPYRPAA